MDPDANLKEQREIVSHIRTDDTNDLERHAERLADLVSAMDEWIMQGGFLPKEWNEANISGWK